MSYRSHWPRYVPVAEKKAKAAKKLKQLKKKNPGIKPIKIKGHAIATTWWGKSWNLNLERYADYSNRIGRGRSYVRHDAVLDLQLISGNVDSLVQGSRSKPYSVNIKIKAVKKKAWREIKTACGGKLDSLQELLAGKFPKALDDVFMAQGRGLFPSPKEIEFSCSCPDWAYMCKHVAATLYGIGARLDEDPELFFKLRKAKMKDLVTGAVKDSARELLKKAKRKTGRVIADADLADVFGIDMEGPVDLNKKEVKGTKKTTKDKSPSKDAPKKARTRSAAGKPRKKTITGRAVPAKKVKSPFDTVVGIVRRSRKGVTVVQIKEKTGLNIKQIRTFVNKARRQGRIKSQRRGVYVKS